MLVSWTSDTVPDIVMDSWRGFLRFMDSDFFLDLSKDFAGRKVKPADFYETAFKAYQIDGKQMGMPQGWGTSLYGINLDLLDNAGVKLPPGFDETWTQDDLVRMLKQVVKFEADGKQALPAGADDGIFFHWLWSYGGDFLNADKTQAATTTPEALAAAEWYARMHTGDRVFMRDGIDKRDGVAFNLGNIAIKGNGIPNSLPDWNRFPFKVDVFQRPQGGRQPRRRGADQPHVHRRLPALQGQQVPRRHGGLPLLAPGRGRGQRGEAGGRQHPLLQEGGRDGLPRPSPPPSRARSGSTRAASTRTDPAHAKWIPDLSNIYGKYSAQLRTGQAGPREAMQNMATDINAVLDEYRRQKGR